LYKSKYCKNIKVLLIIFLDMLRILRLKQKYNILIKKSVWTELCKHYVVKLTMKKRKKFDHNNKHKRGPHMTSSNF